MKSNSPHQDQQSYQYSDLKEILNPEDSMDRIRKRIYKILCRIWTSSQTAKIDGIIASSKKDVQLRGRTGNPTLGSKSILAILQRRERISAEISCKTK